MSSDHASHTTLRRGQFFEYFRARCKTATRSDLPYPDKMVLLTACLDALANHWHSTADPAHAPPKPAAAERMRLFLNRHAQHPAFSKVSAPRLREHLGATNAQVASYGAFPFARYSPDRLNEVATWKDDPDFTELEQANADRKALIACSYGGILYKSLRCEWVHELLPGDEQLLTPESDDLGDDEPYYRYVGNSQRFLLVIPMTFLAHTVQRAIQSFEQEADARRILPFKG